MKNLSRGDGWDYLLNQISRRESRQIEKLGGEPSEIRTFIDRLATRARLTENGRGPIPIVDMLDIFRHLARSSPDDAAQQLLLRMAGLTVAANHSSEASRAGAVVAAAPDQEDAREFVDGDLVDVARAGDVVRFVDHSYDEALNTIFSDVSCQFGLGELGIEVAARRIGNHSLKKLMHAARRAAEELTAPTLAVDLINIYVYLAAGTNDVLLSPEAIVITGAQLVHFEVPSEIDLSWLIFSDSLIEDISLDRENKSYIGPRFRRCLIQNVIGATSIDDLPTGVIDNTNEVTNFSLDVETSADIRQQPLPTAVRVLLITLRKLFVQAGRGRKESAFPRGLDGIEKAFVQDILELLARHQFAYSQRIGGPIIWFSNRDKIAEVNEIFRAPLQSTNDLLVSVRNL